MAIKRNNLRQWLWKNRKQVNETLEKHRRKLNNNIRNSGAVDKLDIMDNIQDNEVD